MIEFANEVHPVVAAFYKGREFGPARAKLRARRMRSLYSHCEILLSRRPKTYFYECASSTVGDGGVRIVSQKLEPAQWDCWMLSHISPNFVRAWFELNDSSARGLGGSAGFFWRRANGSKSAGWAAQACAEAIGVPESWRYDVATFSSLVRLIGEPVALQQAFI